MRISELSEEWRALAEQQRRLGAEPQARTLEYCADALWSVLRANDDELLSLHQAAAESGYTVDHLGRPWTANNSSGTGSATRFDPMTEMFQTAPVGLEAGQSGIQEDAFGRMWVHDGYSAGVGWMDVDTMEIGGMIPYGQVANGICKGISIDLNGNVWSVCSTEAFRIDPDTQQVDVYSGLNYAYTYSDMTGWALQNASCDPRG